MGDKPILFSAPMVRAILDGRKGQTRRVLKPQPVCYQDPPGFSWGKYSGLWPDDWFGYGNEIDGALPYAPGDRLWVREPWRAEIAFDWTPPRDIPVGSPIYFDASPDEPTPECAGKLRPGMFIPRWASRITLEVTDVRVQRLQEISNDDAEQEGCKAEWTCLNPGTGTYALAKDEREVFADLWNSIHGPGSWDANPWVVAVTFRRVTEP